MIRSIMPVRKNVTEEQYAYTGTQQAAGGVAKKIDQVWLATAREHLQQLTKTGKQCRNCSYPV